MTEIPDGMQGLHLPDANPSWRLIMQSGVGVRCMTGIPVVRILTQEFNIPKESIEQIDVVLLDGMPVDDIENAIVPGGARLALAAGLPGIAGLAMKRGSAVKALRGSITHIAETAETTSPAPGEVTLLLYSLVIEMLAPRFLRNGIVATYEQIHRYARFAPDDICLYNTCSKYIAQALEQGDMHPGKKYWLTARIRK